MNRIAQIQGKMKKPSVRAIVISRVVVIGGEQIGQADELLNDGSVCHLAATTHPLAWVVCDRTGKKTARIVKCHPNVAKFVNAAIIQRN